MTLAWFRADAPRPARPLDDTAALIAELRSTHDIEVFTPDNAHDFVSKHARASYELSVHELDNTAAHAFIWPYLLHRPGVVLLRTLAFRDSLSAALQAARVTVVADSSTMEALRLEHPGARVLWAIPAVQGVQRVQRVQASPVIFGVLSRGRIEMIQRAIARAREAGAAAVLLDEAIPERVLQDADVIVSLPWPWFGEAQTPALAAMAAGKPVVVLETAATADWPAFDPQTWRPRGSAGEAPIAVSIDPRDEEHSLLLAVRRLTTDADLRARLATAAHDWWRTHATPRHAADDWERILAEAAQLVDFSNHEGHEDREGHELL